MKQLQIKEAQFISVKECVCGFYPIFVQPNLLYTDLWLQCPNCYGRTHNTGSFLYASEISEETARYDAVI